MKKLLIVCGVIGLGSLVAMAQVPAPAELVVKVTPAEMDLIGEGLGNLPFQKVAPLIQKLRTQIVEQQQAASKPPEGPK